MADSLKESKVWPIPVTEEDLPWLSRESDAAKKRDLLARSRTVWLKGDLVTHLRGSGFQAWDEVPCVGGVVGSSSGRMDVWAIKLQYDERWTAAYEVKISRTDFLNDRNSGKYEKYRGFCRRFYYACPKGLVKKAEIPESCGLITRGDHGWRVIKHPLPNESYEPDVAFVLMLLRRGFAADQDARALRQRTDFAENVPLAYQAKRLGDDVRRKLAIAERGGDLTEDEDARRTREAQAEFCEAVERMMAERLGIKPHRWRNMPLMARVEFVSEILLEADRLWEIGSYLTRYGVRNGERLDELLRAEK